MRALAPASGSNPRSGTILTGAAKGLGRGVGCRGTITRRGDRTGRFVAGVGAALTVSPPPEEPPPEEPDEPPGIVTDTDTVEPVPIRLVPPTDTVTVEPAVKPESSQKVSVAFTNVHDRFTEYAVIAEPPSSSGALHDAKAVVLERAAAVSLLAAPGTVAGTPNAVDVFDESSVEFAFVIATTFTSYAVPFVNPVKVYEFDDWPDTFTAEPHAPPFTRRYTS
jgi:hypothetical protein